MHTLSKTHQMKYAYILIKQLYMKRPGLTFELHYIEAEGKKGMYRWWWILNPTLCICDSLQSEASVMKYFIIFSELEHLVLTFNLRRFTDQGSKNSRGICMNHEWLSLPLSNQTLMRCLVVTCAAPDAELRSSLSNTGTYSVTNASSENKYS